MDKNNNTKLLYDTILKIYNLRKSNNQFKDDISLFCRENQAKKLINIINNI